MTEDVRRMSDDLDAKLREVPAVEHEALLRAAIPGERLNAAQRSEARYWFRLGAEWAADWFHEVVLHRGGEWE